MAWQMLAGMMRGEVRDSNRFRPPKMFRGASPNLISALSSPPGDLLSGIFVDQTQEDP